MKYKFTHACNYGDVDVRTFDVPVELVFRRVTDNKLAAFCCACINGDCIVDAEEVAE
jgi:hypothetical protein